MAAMTDFYQTRRCISIYGIKQRQSKSFSLFVLELGNILHKGHIL